MRQIRTVLRTRESDRVLGHPEMIPGKQEQAKEVIIPKSGGVIDDRVDDRVGKVKTHVKNKD